MFADGVRVSYFAEGRMGYREWARRSGGLGDIYSIEYRYDHDVDELMAKPQASVANTRAPVSLGSGLSLWPLCGLHCGVSRSGLVPWAWAL